MGANIAAPSPVTVTALPLIPVAVAGFADQNISDYYVVVNGLQTEPYNGFLMG